MNEFQVYIDSDGVYHAVETTGAKSLQEVETMLPPNVNHFGCAATDPDQAIKQAKEAGLKYLPPSQIKDLQAKIAEFL